VIETTQYNQNCFVIDHEVVGPDLDIKFVGTPKLVPDLSGRVVVHGHEIVFRHELEDKRVFTELAESGTEMKDYDFRIENVKTAPGCTSPMTGRC
jgi:hypothetical protein